MKACSKCKNSKPIDSFYRVERGSEIRRAVCKTCMDRYGNTYRENNKPKVKEHKMKYKRNNRLKQRNSTLKHKYGIDLKQYGLMFNAQNGLCAICNSEEKIVNKNTGQKEPLSVDHCHKTGQIRSLLCRSCNSGLGKFNDSTELMARALNYLNYYRVKCDRKR